MSTVITTPSVSSIDTNPARSSNCTKTVHAPSPGMDTSNGVVKAPLCVGTDPDDPASVHDKPSRLANAVPTATTATRTVHCASLTSSDIDTFTGVGTTM